MGDLGAVQQAGASAKLAQKGVAYGIPSVRVDGNDKLAVYAVTKAAVARAGRRGADVRRGRDVPPARPQQQRRPDGVPRRRRGQGLGEEGPIRPLPCVPDAARVAGRRAGGGLQGRNRYAYFATSTTAGPTTVLVVALWDRPPALVTRARVETRAFEQVPEPVRTEW
ncbi:MAG: hypothetical protein KF830_18645 [Planctomycetes bacterium]|nr:hypothetical protein [Planctomycetota bacterium]